MKLNKAFFCCWLFCSFAGSSHAAFDTNRIVVLVSLDGLASFYLNDPKAEMPNLRALVREGVVARSMIPVIPTVTWPNHTTLVTGVTPALHGVIANNYFDREKREVVTLIQDPVFDKEQLVKVPTIYDVAKAAGLSTAGIHWPATRNAKNLDWQVPSTRSMENQRQFTTPSLLEECAKNGIHLVDQNIKEREPSVETDALSTQIFDLVLKRHRPQFAMLHIGNVDHAQHEHGPRSAEAYAAMKTQDGQLGEVWRELQTDFPGKATLFVVSDHGFSDKTYYISPHAILQKLGLENTRQGQSNRVEFVTQGGGLLLYILDQEHRGELEQKLSKTFTKEKGVSRVLTAAQFKVNGLATPTEDPHAPDLVVLAGKSYVFGDTSSGQIPAREKPERRGTHGHDPLEPDLHAIFVAWGAGIKSGARLGDIKNVAVAPTIARILQVNLPNAEGKPLNEILAE